MYSSVIRRRMRYFSKKEDRFLRANYTVIPAKRMAKMLGRSKGTARQRMKLLGITVPPESIARFKQESYYQKGAIPMNKGKKMDAEKYRKCKPTMFKKGLIPANTKHDGAISIRVDKTGKRYQHIRTAKSKWELLHRYLWKLAGNKIPRGCLVVFKDGDEMNCTLENLECITRSENMNRNTLHRFPKELAELIQLRGALNRQINKHNEKQNKRSA